MNNYMPQILNDDFDIFFFFNFCHQPLVFVSTVGAGHTLMLTATSGSHHSQPLEFMVMLTPTMPHRQQAFTSESAPLAGLFFNPDQDQGSLQIPPFHDRIENQSQSSMGGTRDQGNHRKHF